eukprot:maker-scaffold_1-snap-gene-23.26-mRNA-1 protein AED:0.01 eAED:0.01 QI:133/0.5/0.33/1/1/1/3/0/657
MSKTKVHREKTSFFLFFGLAYLWHAYLLPVIYNLLGMSWSFLLPFHAKDVLQENVRLDDFGPSFTTKFIILSCLWHTTAFFLGYYFKKIIELCKPVQVISAKAVSLSYVYSKASFFIGTLFFQGLSYFLLKLSYEAKSELIYPYASLFFKEEFGSTAFSWTASVSLSCGFALGQIISDDFHSKRFQKTLLLGFDDINPNLISTTISACAFASFLSIYLVQLSFEESLAAITRDIFTTEAAIIAASWLVYKSLSAEKKKKIKFYSMLLGLWMNYLVACIGCFIPFFLLTFTTHGKTYNYSTLSAFLDFFDFFMYGAYIFPVLLQGFIKIYSAKKRIPWTWKQDSIISFFFTVPLAISCYWRFKSSYVEYPGKPVYLAVSVIHYFYFGLTGRPEVSRNRTSEIWKKWLQPMMDLIADYFSYKIRDNRKVGLLQGPKLYGFHPHGVYPCSLIWQPMCTKFKKEVCDDMVSVCDAFVHSVPLMRDLVQLSGHAEASRESISNLLDQDKSVLLVPGGQGEMFFHTEANFKRKTVVLCGTHKGFIRLATLHKAVLYPCFNFGELDSMKNISLPKLQGLTRRLIGVGLPFLPVGIGGILPLPKKTPMTFCIGEGIDTSVYKYSEEVQFKKVVDTVHQEYLNQLQSLFHKEKDAAGYPNWNIEFK